MNTSNLLFFLLLLNSSCFEWGRKNEKVSKKSISIPSYSFVVEFLFVVTIYAFICRKLLFFNFLNVFVESRTNRKYWMVQRRVSDGNREELSKKRIVLLVVITVS